MNDFQGTPIPKFMGSLEKLTHLKLSQANFGGMVPPNLGNLSNLQYLDLSTFVFYYNIWASDLNWLASLSSLKYLNLGGVNLTEATYWLQSVNTMPSLSELHLFDCQLPNFPNSLQNLNFTSLLVLDLSDNESNSSLPLWPFNISTLVEFNVSSNNFTGSISNVTVQNYHNFQSLDLSFNSVSGDISELLEGLSRCCNGSLKELKLGSNKFSGQLPDSLGNLKYLRSLVVNENLISGPIPESVGKLLFLKELDLSFNQMNGPIPESVGRLTELTKLQLYKNSWKGLLSQNHLQGLAKLRVFSVSSDTTCIFDVRHDWAPPFSLLAIQISNYPLGPEFPAWPRNQKELSSIVLTNVSISDTIPDWIWKLSAQIEILDFSHNQIVGVVPSSLGFFYLVDLSFNRLEGTIPLWPNVWTLHLGHNLFSGAIPLNIGQVMSSLSALDLSGNSLNGSIPLSICKLKILMVLDLSNNCLSGKIPSHWGDLQVLGSIDLSQNNLSDHVPESICSPLFLNWLRLSSNNLSGELSWLQNCKSLYTLDLGDNNFSGKIPGWIGENLLLLSKLRMRANSLTGNIPQQLCLLSDLHILDLGHNYFTGSIPSCIGNLSGFSHLTASNSPFGVAYRLLYSHQMDLVVKGRKFGYILTLELVNVIDLSSNNLIGEIPEEIANLSALGTLNLSRNQLTGKIPEKIGELRWLETLDLSSNQISGSIPSSMTSLTSLSHLNLSYNNLSGSILSTNQFQTFNDPSIYEGNPELCGLPLSTKCFIAYGVNAKDNDVKDKDDNEDESDYDELWFYLSMGVGFIVGFWAVCGSLVLKKSWRYAYFRFLDKVKDWLCVKIAINVAVFRRMMETKRN